MLDCTAPLSQPAFRTWGSGFWLRAFGLVELGEGEFFELGDEGF